MAEPNRKEYYNRQFLMTNCPLASGEENVDILLDYCNRKLDPARVEVFEKKMQCAPGVYNVFHHHQMPP